MSATVTAAESARRHLVILLHGVGARGADMARAARGLAPHLPDTDFAMPDAPDPFDGGRAARQWFSLQGITPENRPARVAAARAALDVQIARALARHGMQDHPGRVALVGFSQGAIMVLDVLASGRWTFAAHVALCGRLAFDGRPTPRPGARGLLIHGETDGVIPAWESDLARARLAECGADVTCRIAPRLGHDFNAEGLAEAGAFIAAGFAQLPR